MDNRFTRKPAGHHPDPRLGRMLLASLVLHLLAVLVFSGILLPRFQRDVRPVYHVDLVNLPVKDPQAGRPDARPQPPRPEPAKKPEPVRTASPPPPAKPEPEPVRLPPPKPQPKPEAPKVAKKPAAEKAAVKKQPEPPKPAPQANPEPAPRESYEDALSAIERLKRKKEIEELQKSLAALGQNDPRQTAPVDAPVGVTDGTGSEAGVSYDVWLQEYLKQAWTLSQYQVSRRDLEAVVVLVFDARGNLVDYRFLEKSAEGRFDDSVRKAVLRLKKLPTEPGRRLEKEVKFNLKELLE